MRQITYQEALQTLRKAGFIGPEITRLYHLRRTYQTSEMDQASLDLHRLEFVRWLVATGRLTDHLPDEQGQAASLSQERSEREKGSSRVRGSFPLFRRKE